MSLVYFLLDATPTSQHVKIGTTINLQRRLGELSSQTLSRQQPLVLALVEGSYDVEQAHHGLFGSLRTRGEWFVYDAHLRAYIETLPHPLSWLIARPDLWPYAGGWCHLSTLQVWTEPSGGRPFGKGQAGVLDTPRPEVPEPVYF